MIGKLLGHSQAQTTHRYAHLAADPVKQASERIAGAIAGMISVHGELPQAAGQSPTAQSARLRVQRHIRSAASWTKAR